MNYALIEDGVVCNVIWLYPGNASDFPNAVALGDRSVRVGDTYENGVFTRDGVPLLTPLEEAENAIAELDAAIVELAYENVMLGLEMG